MEESRGLTELWRALGRLYDAMAAALPTDRLVQQERTARLALQAEWYTAWKALVAPQNIALFEKYGVYSRNELVSRYEIFEKDYLRSAK